MRRLRCRWSARSACVVACRTLHLKPVRVARGTSACTPLCANLPVSTCVFLLSHPSSHVGDAPPALPPQSMWRHILCPIARPQYEESECSGTTCSVTCVQSEFDSVRVHLNADRQTATESETNKKTPTEHNVSMTRKKTRAP